jgi:hypothetical protein
LSLRDNSNRSDTHPSDTCTEETMYRFIGMPETKKQTLEAGDLAGIAELYR